jgi:hypothetical protein
MLEKMCGYRDGREQNATIKDAIPDHLSDTQTSTNLYDD